MLMSMGVLKLKPSTFGGWVERFPRTPQHLWLGQWGPFAWSLEVGVLGGLGMDEGGEKRKVSNNQNRFGTKMVYPELRKALRRRISAAIYGWDCPLLTVIYPGFHCGSGVASRPFQLTMGRIMRPTAP